jgi:hypothetical protein
MRLIGLAVILAVSLMLAQLVAEAQPSATSPRIGLLSPTRTSGGLSGSDFAIWATLRDRALRLRSEALKGEMSGSWISRPGSFGSR